MPGALHSTAMHSEACNNAQVFVTDAESRPKTLVTGAVYLYGAYDLAVRFCPGDAQVEQAVPRRQDRPGPDQRPGAGVAAVPGALAERDLPNSPALASRHLNAGLAWCLWGRDCCSGTAAGSLAVVGTCSSVPYVYY